MIYHFTKCTCVVDILVCVSYSLVLLNVIFFSCRMLFRVWCLQMNKWKYLQKVETYIFERRKTKFVYFFFFILLVIWIAQLFCIFTLESQMRFVCFTLCLMMLDCWYDVRYAFRLLYIFCTKYSIICLDA